MGLKEQVAKATNAGSLAWTRSDEQHSERAVDRVAALGLAQLRVVNPEDPPKERIAVTRERDHLAACLWKLKYGGDRTRGTYQRVFHGVCGAVHGRHTSRPPSDVLRAVVSIAIEEWRVETCPTCHGRKFVGGVYDVSTKTAETNARMCIACNGMGILERNDHQRAEAVMNLLRMAETDRLQRSVRRVFGGNVTFIVSARPSHFPDLRRAWGKGWGDKYQKALGVILEHEARLGAKVRRQLEEPR